MLDEAARRKVRLLASLSVQARRAMGVEPERIRREARAVAVEAIEEEIGDQVLQESWLAEFDRCLELELERTRPADEAT